MNDQQLMKTMKANGIVNPDVTLRETRRAGLELPIACALLEQETSGGDNVFGHDRTIFMGAGKVTKEKYLAYKRERDRYLRGGVFMFQGVGPTQLTWYTLQDRADAAGGCHLVESNMRVGFSHLRALIRAKGLHGGLLAYNGGAAYPRQVIPRIQQWRRRFADGGSTTSQTKAHTHSKPHGPYAAEFVRLCLAQKGDRYVYGAEANWRDPNPRVFDCSELVEWAVRRAGGYIPDGSTWQEAYCRQHGTMTSVERAFGVQGALLFRHRGKDQHIAVSLGNGSTIEARGRAYGVNSFSARGRVWTAAALVPGMTYRRVPDPVGPRWPGRYMTQPPPLRGADVQRWQRRMRARGWQIPVDGTYERRSAEVCRMFQREKGLLVDGIVGPDTWHAAWAAPVTP
jgi:cell wall-associated NlpC family hydrolase